MARHFAKPHWTTFACALLLALPAQAATTASIPVSATISAGCGVSSLGTSGNAGEVGRLNFGENSLHATDTHTTSLVSTQNVIFQCTPGVPLRMQINGGQNSASGHRYLQRGANTSQRIRYYLYMNAALTTEIFPNITYTIAVDSSNSTHVVLPIHGRLILSGGLPAGVYSDTLQITFSW